MKCLQKEKTNSQLIQQIIVKATLYKKNKKEQNKATQLKSYPLKKSKNKITTQAIVKARLYNTDPLILSSAHEPPSCTGNLEKNHTECVVSWDTQKNFHSWSRAPPS